jgi:hypothetical protein
MLGLAKIAWHRWQIIGEAFNDFVGRLIAVLFYFTIFVPFAVGVRLLGDPLHIRSAPQQWLQREPVGSQIDDARRQF